MRKVNSEHMSNTPYYLDVLQVLFIEFLREQGASVKTRRNYRSDAKHFLSWFIFTIESTSRSTLSSINELVSLISPDLIERYKAYLVANKIPIATINRRLSTIRKFFSFCQSRGWIATNPAKKLTSIQTHPNTLISSEKMLEQFKRDLTTEGSSKATVKNYVSDVRQFMNWLEDRAIV